MSKVSYGFRFLRFTILVGVLASSLIGCQPPTEPQTARPGSSREARAGGAPRALLMATPDRDTFGLPRFTEPGARSRRDEVDYWARTPTAIGRSVTARTSATRASTSGRSFRSPVIPARASR